MRWQDRFFRRKRAERRLQAELAFHLDQKTAELIAAGLEPDEARRRARIGFGSLDRCQEACRESGRAAWFESWLQDLRYGLRQMRKAPGFTAVAVLTLALGIGANTAIFSVVNQLFLRPLPWPHAGRIVVINLPLATLKGDLSHPGIQVFGRRELQRAFTAVAEHTSHGVNLSVSGGLPMRVKAAGVSANFARVFGAKPILGRFFSSFDLKEPVAILGYRLWRVLGSDPRMLGQTISLNSHLYAVIGVMPPGFRVPGETELWVPLPQFLAGGTLFESSTSFIQLLALRRTGTTWSQVTSVLKMLEARMRQQGRYWGNPLHPHHNPPLFLRLNRELAGKQSVALRLLMAATGLLLLLACANLANLLLGRNAAREREFALRLSLGATRRRLLRQLLIEYLLLALAGAALGLALAAGAGGLVRQLAPAHWPGGAAQLFDPRVLAFSALVSLACVVLFGLLPAWRAARLNLNQSLKLGYEYVASGRRRLSLQGLLIAAETALALMLLSGAGLLLKSLNRLLSVPPGFQPQHVISFHLSIPFRMHLSLTPPKLSAGAVAHERQLQSKRYALLVSIQRRLLGLPGVRQVGITSLIPLEPMSWFAGSFSIRGKPRPANPMTQMAGFRVADHGFFRALDIPLLVGTWLQPGQPDAVLINQAMARQFWPNRNPVGQQIDFGGNGHWLRVVGVVGSLREMSLHARPQPNIYFPLWQRPIPETSWVIRVDAPLSVLAPEIRRAVAAVDPQLPIYRLASLDHWLQLSTRQPRLRAELLAAFALLALSLATGGLAGVTAYNIARRTREIGIRMALGAEALAIRRLVWREGLAWTGAGLAAGLAGTLAISALLRHFLFEVRQNDPLVLAGTAALLAAFAWLACDWPARRALRINPVEALRSK